MGNRQPSAQRAPSRRVPSRRRYVPDDGYLSTFRLDMQGPPTKQRQRLMLLLDEYLRECLIRGRRGSLVFDIDDTLISENNGHTIRTVLNLYNRYVGVFPIYLVSARSERDRQLTLDELEAKGVRGFRALRLLTPGDADDPGRFKARERRNIGNVLATIGDQPWDVLPRRVPHEMKDLMQAAHTNGAFLRCRNSREVGALLPRSSPRR